MHNLFNVRTRKEIETRRRIQICVAAYSYEFAHRPKHENTEPFMSDHEFDRLAQQIDLSINTDRPDMDAWFRANFHPCTGSWIYDHPELQRIGELYQHGYYRNTNR